MNEWRRSTWGEEISLEYGKSLRDYSDVAGHFRVFGTNGPIGWTDKPLADGPGVILGRKGAYRGVHYSSDPFFVIDTAYYVIPKTDLDMRWLYYAIIHHQLGKIDDGSPIPSTTRAAVYPREIFVPEPDEAARHRRHSRRARRQNRSEPADGAGAGSASAHDLPGVVRRLRAGEGQGRRCGLLLLYAPARLRRPAHRFVDSDIGPVPEGWEVKEIGDVVTTKGGGTPNTKNPEYWGGEHCWVTPKDMSRLSHPVLLDTERRITEAAVNSISSGMLPVGTVLMSSRAPVGYLGIARVPTAINQGFIAMVCDGPLPPTYVLNWASTSMDVIKAHASGTTFPEISKNNFRRLPVVLPIGDVIAAYQQTSDPLFDLLAACVKESLQLTQVRDYLLPQLLSGTVRVRS